MQVVQVYERRLAQVIVGKLDLAHLGSEDGLYGGRQRGIAYGKRLVVCEVARLLLWSERVAAQVHRQDKVGLLDDLLAIEIKVREVQQQGVLLRSSACEVPHLVFSKGFVLWGHSEALVVRDEHLLGCLAPTGGLFGVHAERACLPGMALP